MINNCLCGVSFNQSVRVHRSIEIRNNRTSIVVNCRWNVIPKRGANSNNSVCQFGSPVCCATLVAFELVKHTQRSRIIHFSRTHNLMFNDDCAWASKTHWEIYLWFFWFYFLISRSSFLLRAPGKRRNYETDDGDEKCWYLHVINALDTLRHRYTQHTAIIHTVVSRACASIWRNEEWEIRK